MGEADEPDADAETPHAQEDHGDDGHSGHAHPIGEAIGINVAINAILNAISGYGIAWLHWQDYSIAWYTHHLHETFETGFVVEDVVVQGASTAVIVTLIVSAILHRQWEHGMLEAGRIEAFLVDEERTRGRHMLAWSLGTALAGGVFAGLVAAIATGSAETVSGSTFAWTRTVVGFLVGGTVGGLVTASWVTNLSAGTLVPPEGGQTVIARTMGRAGRHAWVLLVGVLLVTAGLGAGLTGLHTDVDETDRMPRGSHHHEGAEILGDAFNATHGDGVQLHFRTDPDRCRADNDRHLQMRAPEDVTCGNITDEVYLRAMDEFGAFLESYTHEPDDGPLDRTSGDEEDEDEGTEIESPVEAGLGPASYLKLANWTIAGGQDRAPDEAYALPAPEDRARVNAAEELVADHLADAQLATVGPEADQATVRYQVDPGTELTSQQIGAFVLEARDAYLDWAPANAQWDVFTSGNAPLHDVDQAEANAHQAGVLGEDLRDVAPLAAAALVVTLVAVFRNPLAGLVGATGVVAAGAWTFGTLGHLDVALSELDLVVAPLVLAAGALFTTQTIEAFLEATEEGYDTIEALEEAGDRAAFPMYLGATITALGLLVLGLGPTALVADAAWLAILALASLVLVTVTFVPATLALVGARGRSIGLDPSAAVAAVLGPLRSRGVAALLVAALTVAGLVGVADLDREGLRQPVQAWPAEDALGEEHRRGVAGFHGLSIDDPAYAEHAIVVEGDPAEPETLAYLEQLADELAATAEDSQTLATPTQRDLSGAIRDWLAVCCGAQGLAERTLVDQLGGEGPGEEVDRYPTTRQEARDTLEAMFDSPYASVVRPLVPNATGNATVQTIHVQGEDGQAAQRGWDEVTGVLASLEGEEPDRVETSYVGPGPTNHLTIEDQLDWFAWALLAAVAMAAVFGFGYTLNPAAALALASVPALTALWGLGGLALVDEPFTVAAGLGLVVGVLAGTALGARAVWAIAQGRGAATTATTGVASLLGVAGLLALVPTAVDPSAGLGNLVLEDALVAAMLGVSAAFAASLLVPRLLLARASEPTSKPEAADTAGDG